MKHWAHQDADGERAPWRRALGASEDSFGLLYRPGCGLMCSLFGVFLTYEN